MKFVSFVLLTALTACMIGSSVMSCRESLESTTDMRYEDLIVGAWFYSFQSDSGAASITFIFSADKTTRIINTALGLDTTYNYYIEAGILYLTSDDVPPEVLFNYAIEQLDLTTLVITFSSSGSQIRQVYTRTAL